MFVTKNRLYTELCKVAEVLIKYGDAIEDIRETHLEDVMELNSQIHSLSMTIKHLTERVEALEAKKTVKKTTTKKAKGK
jgi:regulator of replication initiation timing